MQHDPALWPAAPAVTPTTPPASDAAAPEAVEWFGDEPVRVGEKVHRVRRVFDIVAPRYDLMNDLMSLGVHRLWKDALVRQIRPQPREALLDVAGGTGDVAFRWHRAVTAHGAPVLPVTVCDINERMLAVGRDRQLDQGVTGAIAWVVGDAERLPFPRHTFDVYTIAFGLRNVTGMEAALAEAQRVLRPGGRLFCLEFSHVGIPALDALYRRWSDHVLPRIGTVVARDRDAYVYLVESIRRFPPQPRLAAMIEAAGFGVVRWRDLSGGIAAIHSGWRL